MAEWNSERVSELERDRIDGLFGQLDDTRFAEDYLELAQETLDEPRSPMEGEASGYQIETDEGPYQVLAVPFEGVPQPAANIVLVYRDGTPEHALSSVTTREDSTLTVRRLAVGDAGIEPTVATLDLSNLPGIDGFQTPSLPDRCTSCKSAVGAAKYVGCGLAPTAICAMAGVPTIPSIGCDVVVAAACELLQRQTDYSRQDVCNDLGLCPP